MHERPADGCLATPLMMWPAHSAEEEAKSKEACMYGGNGTRQTQPDQSAVAVGTPAGHGASPGETLARIAGREERGEPWERARFLFLLCVGVICERFGTLCACAVTCTWMGAWEVQSRLPS
eukprot:scaffold63_cov306-Pinguiococcus_pyrenoidosus.AAC.33